MPVHPELNLTPSLTTPFFGSGLGRLQSGIGQDVRLLPFTVLPAS
ncbi:hypothetical protein WSK_2767 [Novosphingobium sp. Rr 2-17]|nr:hypothetical protein WSK_2767 [Novosphingobium sp. Rr 2-17]